MAADDLFAKPLAVGNLSECVFYHAMDLPRSGSVNGEWDLRGRFDEYTGGVKFAGKTVLDVGTSSGFLTFEAEKRGADVVSLDARSAHDFCRMPVPGSLYVANYSEWELQAGRYLSGIKSAYWWAHRELDSRARAHYGSVYDLSPDLGKFDVVIVGQILVHLSDVLRALTSIAPRCRETLVIAEGMIDTDQPLSHFLGRADRPENDYAFWHHSIGVYREILAMFGFRLRSKQTRAYRCNVPWAAPAIDITTLVFRST